MKISYWNTFYFFRNAHVRYVKSLFTNVLKVLKISLLFKKLQTSRTNNSKILRIKNARFSGYCFCMNTNKWGNSQICISVSLTTTPSKSFYIIFVNIFSEIINAWKNRIGISLTWNWQLIRDWREVKQENTIYIYDVTIIDVIRVQKIPVI